MDPKTMPNRRCKCEDKSHEKCPVVHGTDHCTVHLGSIISQSIEKVTFYSYFDYLVMDNLHTGQLSRHFLSDK